MAQRRKENSDNKPVKVFQLRGISISLFENYSDNDIPYYKASVKRTFKDGDEFKSNSIFGRDDLPLLMQLAHEAWLDILERESEAARNSRNR
ncbi:hypothetical protein [Calycomorphotria hydatis]|nr:hypothetical protein [Calycomorphotria hydatis]